MNCLAYALRFWEKEPNYVLYYNSDHVVNLPEGTEVKGFLPAEKFGYVYFAGAAGGLLDEYEQELLKRYFNK